MRHVAVIRTALAATAALAAPAAFADGKVEEHTKFEVSGTVGKLVNVFGGKAAREGVNSVRILSGDKRLNKVGDQGELVDLGAERVYQLDFDDKTYTVKTFDEIRQEMREALERARQQQEEASKEQRDTKDDEAQGAEKPPEYEVDVEAKETGKKEKIAGFDARQVILTATVREKGKKLEEAGGGVLVADMWLGPRVPTVDELNRFELEYVKRLDVEAMAEAQRAAAAIAAYPGLQQALKAFQDKKVNMDGTPLRTILTLDVVASPEQQAQAESQEESTGVGGLLGKLGSKLRKKKDKPAQGDDGLRRTVFTSTTTTLAVAPDAPAGEVAIPAGFRQKK